MRGAWYVGEADFLLQLRLADMAAFETFAREVLHDDPNVRSFRTMVVMREIVEWAEPWPRPPTGRVTAVGEVSGGRGRGRRAASCR
ncbi:MAG: Lrp/AsnC ligand binding domain-containing protein [Geminicoccaceae bacterium]